MENVRRGTPSILEKINKERLGCACEDGKSWMWCPLALNYKAKLDKITQIITHNTIRNDTFFCPHLWYVPRCGLDSDEYLMNGFDFLQPFCVISFKLEVMRRVGLVLSSLLLWPFVFGLFGLYSVDLILKEHNLSLCSAVHSTKLKSIYWWNKLGHGVFTLYIFQSKFCLLCQEV